MTIKKIGFNAANLNLRGTLVATFDYAKYNQKILGNESIIYYNEKVDSVAQSVFEKFNNQFQMVGYKNFNDLQKLTENKIDSIYLIKPGQNDSNILPNMKNLVHAVFPQTEDQMHGEKYAFISEWLSMECSNGKIPYVPHMIDIEISHESLKNDLNIPDNAIVFGYYGGSDSFNIDWVQKKIIEITELRNDIYFLFMNVDVFSDSKKIIFLPGTADMSFKSKFINTCDAMLHARGLGESFGIACGEFSVHNKPIIAWDRVSQRAHLDILRNKALLYKNDIELHEIITQFDKQWSEKQNWDCYSEKFSPKNVMCSFNEVFLK